MESSGVKRGRQGPRWLEMFDGQDGWDAEMIVNGGGVCIVCIDGGG